MKFAYMMVIGGLAVAAAVPASAALLTGAGSLSGANPIYLPAANYTGTGPKQLGPITWTSDQAGALYGSTAGYSFGNGTIPVGDPFIALNAMYDVASGGYARMSLTFDTPVAGFLADIYWTEGFSNAQSTIMAAYDVNGDLIINPEYPTNDSRRYYWQFTNNGNSIGRSQGYYGFSYDTPVIKTVLFANGQIGARDLSWTGPAVNVPTGGVPEPATWTMLLAGFLAVGSVRRTRSGRVRAC